jgi:hypothetical protein
VLDVGARLPDLEPLADADDRGHAGRLGPLGLGADQRVVLRVVLPTLGVAYDDVGAAELASMAGGHLAGVGAALVRGDVLRAVADVQPVAVDQSLDAAADR